MHINLNSPLIFGLSFYFLHNYFSYFHVSKGFLHLPTMPSEYLLMMGRG